MLFRVAADESEHSHVHYPQLHEPNYGVAQSLLLAMFAAGYLLDASRRSFGSRAAAGVGLAVCAAGLLLMFSALASLRAVVQVAPEPRAAGTWSRTACIAVSGTRSTPPFSCW